ncbi:hypothetical protein [Halopiger thermotolerans]
MSLERFIQVNLVLAPLLFGAGYLFYESLPVIVLPLGFSYLCFVVVLGFAWVMSRLSMAVRSS